MNNADHTMHDDDTEVIARQSTPAQADDATMEMDMPLSERFADFEADGAPAPDDGDTRETPVQTVSDETTVVFERTDVDEPEPTSVMPQQDADDATRPMSTGWSWSSDASAPAADTPAPGTAAPDGTFDAAVIAEDTAPEVDTPDAAPSAPTPPPPPAGAVPMYSAPQPTGEPRVVRPEGASARTNAFGVVVTNIGALTILVGATMNSGLLDHVDWRGIVNWTLMGLGVLLSVIAIVWGLVSHVRNRRRDGR
ncbi:MAG: hypothetical protein K2I40_00710 [Bifidobacterium castoris]|nr:hypothetical protein [Bifidobacterium castoris]